jgi:G:T-mismatch repair DNA endonuclease (very short patch repair protein)
MSFEKNGRKKGQQLKEETLNNKVRCLVCGKIQKNYIALPKHLQHQHKMKSKDYYDRFVREFREGRCKVCGKETRWENITCGYKDFCSAKCSQKFHVGENAPFYNKKHSEESLRKIGKSSSERIHSDEGRKNISNGLKRSYEEKGDFHKSPEYRKKMSESLMGHESSEECNRKISKANRGKVSSFKDKHHTKENQKIIAEKRSRYFKNWKEKDPESYKGWTSDRIKKSLAKVCERPNKFEQNCHNALEAEFPGKFKYVGDGSVLINYRSPDFINEKDKVIVLCHGVYWHLLKEGLENTKENKLKIERKDSKPFEKAGYTVIVIWEDEI